MQLHSINISPTRLVHAPRVSTTKTRYQPDSQAARVSAEDTYNAATLNMPPGAWAGRWERWAPPESCQVSITHAGSPQSDSSDWQLLTSGQSVYVFKPSDSANSLSVSVMEAPDSPAVSMAQAAAQAATEQALLVGTAAATPTTNNLPPPPSVVDSSATSNVVRAENKFSLEDHFFRPFLPDHTQPGGDVGLRLWAADGLGFVMAPTALPLSLLHTQPLSGQAAAAAADEHRHVPAPFIANMYIKHPSLEPGTGRRWGWNLQFDPTAPCGDQGATATPLRVGALQHIHHTSLGVQGDGGGGERGRGTDDLLRPGPHTRPPTAPRSLPPSIAAFMNSSSGDGRSLSAAGSAVEFSYQDGQLTRTDLPQVSWTAAVGPASAGGVAEVWYSSGGYTRCPLCLQAELAAGRPVVFEAGAIIHRDSSLAASVEGVARWLLSYRAGDGQLASVRLEVYNKDK